MKNLSHLIKYLKKRNDIKLGIQISHSGRKGSSEFTLGKVQYAIKR